MDSFPNDTDRYVLKVIRTAQSMAGGYPVRISSIGRLSLSYFDRRLSPKGASAAVARLVQSGVCFYRGKSLVCVRRPRITKRNILRFNGKK